MSLVQTCFGFSSSISADIYREQVVRFRPVESKVMHLGGDRGVGGWVGGLEVATLRRFMKFMFKVIQYLRERFHTCAVGETFHGEAQCTTQPCKFNFFSKYIAEHITHCFQRLVIPKSEEVT